MQYLVKYNMLKWFKNIFKDWNEVQDEIASMGIFTHPWGSYFSKEMFDDYCKKMEKGDQSSSKSSK